MHIGVDVDMDIDIDTYGQIMASSTEVALNSSYCWGSSRAALSSGFGVVAICPES